MVEIGFDESKYKNNNPFLKLLVGGMLVLGGGYLGYNMYANNTQVQSGIKKEAFSSSQNQIPQKKYSSLEKKIIFSPKSQISEKPLTIYVDGGLVEISHSSSGYNIKAYRVNPKNPSYAPIVNEGKVISPYGFINNELNRLKCEKEKDEKKFGCSVNKKLIDYMYTNHHEISQTQYSLLRKKYDSVCKNLK